MTRCFEAMDSGGLTISVSSMDVSPQTAEGLGTSAYTVRATALCQLCNLQQHLTLALMPTAGNAGQDWGLKVRGWLLAECGRSRGAGVIQYTAQSGE